LTIPNGINIKAFAALITSVDSKWRKDMAIGPIVNPPTLPASNYDSERDRIKAETEAEHLESMKETLEAKKASWDKQAMNAYQ
jgi:hypothetical protein